MWALGTAVPIAVVDISDYRIPNRIVFPALLVSGGLFALQGFLGAGPAVRAVAGAALFYALLGVIHLITPARMGYGDVKLAALLGLPLGWQAWQAVPMALMAASILGIALHGLLVATSRRRWGDALPFGVYLALGATVTVAVGGETLQALLAPA